mgnify:CR=1 FL=1
MTSDPAPIWVLAVILILSIIVEFIPRKHCSPDPVYIIDHQYKLKT